MGVADGQCGAQEHLQLPTPIPDIAMLRRHRYSASAPEVSRARPRQANCADRRRPIVEERMMTDAFVYTDARRRPSQAQS